MSDQAAGTDAQDNPVPAPDQDPNVVVPEPDVDVPQPNPNPATHPEVDDPDVAESE